MYLMIENLGTSDYEALTMLGVSSSRNSDDENTIGKFGSGVKHGINLLLRKGINPIIYTGKTKLYFYTKPKSINTIGGSTDVAQVYANITNDDSSQDTQMSYVLGFGEMDWNDVGMAIREFVSNAIDAATVLKKPIDEVVKLDIVSKDECREGYTRIFIPLTPEVQSYYNTIGKRFLHFSAGDEINQKVLKKSDRCLDGSKAVCWFRRGVLIGVGDKNFPSLFDYNFNDIKLNESREVNPNEADLQVGRIIADASVDVLSEIMETLTKGSEYYEHTLSQFALCGTLSPDHKRRWQEAFTKTFGNKAIVTHNDYSVKTISDKGFTPVFISNYNWYRALKWYGVKTSSEILSSMEEDGIKEHKVTPTLLARVKTIWSKLDKNDLTFGKELPQVKCYDRLTDAGSMLMGFYNDGTVYFHTDLEGQSSMLDHVILEELSHYISGSMDYTRDFQNYLVKVAIKGLMK